LVTPRPDEDREDELQALRPFCERIEIVPTPYWRRVWRLGGTLFTPLPLQTLYFFDPRFRTRVQLLVREHAFDSIHVQTVRMAPVVAGLEDIPKVLDLIDALSLNMARRAQRQSGPLAWIAAFEARRVRRYERKLTRLYDQLVVCSPLDREAIGEYNNVHVIPNGVDLDSYSFKSDDREPGMIVLTGRMGYFPNADAAKWFTQKVFPLVCRQVGRSRLFIVGADPPFGVRRLARCAGVTVTGYVPSLHDYLSRATVAVAPTQSGSGMQNKVLEAMSSGAPVVATPYAVGGLEAEDGEHLLVARGAEEFASRVVRLLQDTALRHRLARNARRIMEEKYTWERSAAMLEDIYRGNGGGGSKGAQN